MSRLLQPGHIDLEDWERRVRASRGQRDTWLAPADPDDGDVEHAREVGRHPWGFGLLVVTVAGVWLATIGAWTVAGWVADWLRGLAP